MEIKYVYEKTVLGWGWQVSLVGYFDPEARK